MTSTTHLFEAMMARIQYRGSEELALVIPYRGNLAAHQIHEQSHHRPQAALSEGNLDVSFPTGGAYLLLGVLHFRHESTEGFADMKDIDYTQR